MKKHLFGFLLVGIILAITGCGGGSQPAAEKTDEVETVAVVDFPDTSFWSTWTPEERRINIKQGQIMAWHLKLVEKRFVLDISRADFVKTGLPDSLYDDAMRGFESVNRNSESMKIEDVKKEYETLMGQLRLLFGTEPE